jgi:hypothetical protein
VIIALVVIGDRAGTAPIASEPPPDLKPGEVTVDASGVRWQALAAVLETVWTKAPPAFFNKPKRRR